jgi:hypothetical protein
LVPGNDVGAEPGSKTGSSSSQNSVLQNAHIAVAIIRYPVFCISRPLRVSALWMAVCERKTYDSWVQAGWESLQSKLSINEQFAQFAVFLVLTQMLHILCGCRKCHTGLSIARNVRLSPSGLTRHSDVPSDSLAIR